jgi:tRNA-splicing ligase RtcB (3'-phosphate/5'-hydroxy nucleic acid ligase)
MSLRYSGPLERIDDYRWRVPRTYMKGMRVDGIVYASDRLIDAIRHDNALQQVANVAMLPGITRYSLAMPDIHWGYGFSIGGVAATDIEAGGVISPGGVGFDINCGVRLLKTGLFESDIKRRLTGLMRVLYQDVPAGVGSKGNIKVTARQEERILLKGSGWALSQGYAIASDIEHTEEHGAIEGADPEAVSERAYERGMRQSGTLGSGNHFIEIQAIDKIYDEKAAAIFGISKGQITVMIHSGSRGLGYQICDDYARRMVHTLSKYNITVIDRQLACAPFNSQEGKLYFGAMKCAANYAWNNRQCLMHLVRLAFEKIFRQGFQALGMFLVYDVAHNIAKIERHDINGRDKALCVHRKGATRAFGPGNAELPSDYRDIGQPVIIPGDMGTHSYLMLGTETAMKETFGTTCHGAGRVLSRKTASQRYSALQVREELNKRGIVLMASGKETISEEAPGAYKDIDDVIDAVAGAGISKKVCRMRPLGVLKG